jgi:Rrf2 family iron-sulfur cluster assembly transcriptional regulator
LIHSAATKYAIRAVCHIGHLPPGSKAQVKEISEALDIPQAFLSKILQDLARKGILSSTKGPGGGFSLNCSPEDCSLYSLVEAVEGPLSEGECLLGLSLCAEETKCPLHDTWKDIQDAFRQTMESTSVKDVVEADKRKRAALEHDSLVALTLEP